MDPSRRQTLKTTRVARRRQTFKIVAFVLLFTLLCALNRYENYEGTISTEVKKSLNENYPLDSSKAKQIMNVDSTLDSFPSFELRLPNYSEKEAIEAQKSQVKLILANSTPPFS